MDKVRPFHFWVQRILPLVYDDSLSYYEVLCKVVRKLNEVIETYNNIVTDVDEQITNLFNAWETEWTAKINAALAAQDAKLDSAIANQNQQIQNIFAEQDKYLKDQLKDIQNANDVALAAMQAYLSAQIAALMVMFNNNNAEIKCWVNLQLEKLRNEIPEITSVIVNNPVTNERQPIQDVLDCFYNIFRYGAITAGEFNAANITMEEFDNLYITMFRFDFYALKYIWPRRLTNQAHSPIDGRFKWQYQLIYMLFDYHKPEGMTAHSWDEREISVEEYQDMDLTAYAYDWHGETFLGG